MEILNRIRRAIFGMNKKEATARYKMVCTCLEEGIEYITLHAMSCKSLLSNYRAPSFQPLVETIPEYQPLDITTVMLVRFIPRHVKSLTKHFAAEEVIEQFFEVIYLVICSDVSREGVHQQSDRVLCDNAKKIALYNLDRFKSA